MDRFQKQLLASRRVLVLAGAGLSAASGLQPFKISGERATWNGVDMADLATPEAFAVDPQLVWGFHAERRQIALAAAPNAAHFALARLTQVLGADRVLTLTQNEDALSEAAGHPQPALVHMHGELFVARCVDRRCQYSARNFDPELGARSAPECPRCGAYLRPGVTWFGEAVPFSAIVRATEAIEDGIDLVMCVGMSADVWPAAGYIDEIVARGGTVAVFNQDPGAAPPGALVFPGNAEQTVPLALEPVVGKISVAAASESSDLSELSDSYGSTDGL